ncbi:MAG TPA: GNAT family N-acetyltransferase [Polyangia bacterium]|nr:GNAT family N-acetyltransferase [Polyangia bacterium]
MHVIRVEDAPQFMARAGVFLVAREAENNLMLGILGELLQAHPKVPAGGPPLLCLVQADDGALTAAAIQAPPHLLILTAAPEEAVAALAEHLATAGARLPGVIGPALAASSFADRWAARTGRQAQRVMNQRIYSLESVVPPAPVPGRLRPATRADLDLATRWFDEFLAEVGLHEPQSPAALAEGRITHRQLFVWDVGDGGPPVSMAAWAGPTPNGVRVNFVYTPPAERHKGYAAACVAALSRQLLDEGSRFCFLFTDIDNKTTNALYQRLGYQAVCDSYLYKFSG